MVGLLDFFKPEDQKLASLGLLGLQIGGGMLGAGQQGYGGFGQIGAGLTQGLNNYAQMQQGQEIAALRAMQTAEAKRKAEREAAQQAALAGLFEPKPAQVAMAESGTVGPTPAAAALMTPPVAQMFPGTDPEMLRNYAQAFPDQFSQAVGQKLLPKDRAPLVVGPGAAAIDPASGRKIFENPRAERPTELDRLFDEAGIPPNDPRRSQLATQILERKGQPMSVKIDNVGSIPAGYELMTTPEGAKRMQVIPGSPAAVEAERLAKAKSDKATLDDIVVQDARRALELSSFWTTGIIGSQLARVPGTPQHDLARILDTLEASASFDRLQQMRNESTTGGALGQITVRELELLGAAMGNLKQSQSRPQFERNLKRYHDLRLDIIHGKGKGPERLTGKDAEAESPQELRTIYPGKVEDGYRFKGGNPGDRANWEKVR